MKVLSLNLCDLIRLRVSKIREIAINTEFDNTQLIIGSNGSGKSSIMHELFPYPPTKTSFGKLGYKSIKISHNNAIYDLIYSTENGHRFERNGENLNTSTTNEIQKDLIFEHFGVNSDIHTIMKGALPICEMIPSQRKKILMGMNPVNIEFFLDRYAKVHKDVVSYSNNLDRLYDRQKQLLSQKLPDEQYKSMLERKALLENQEKLLLIWMTTVSSELDLYKEVTGNTKIDKSIIDSIYSIFKTLPRFSSVSRTRYKSDLVTYNTKFEMINVELADIEASITEVVAKLDDYEKKKDLLRQDEDNVEEELSNACIQLKEFSFKDEFSPISEEQINNVIGYNEKIRNSLVELSYIHYSKIVDKSELHEFQQRLNDLKAVIDNAVNILNITKNQLNDIKKSITIYKTDDTCNKKGCELYEAYSSRTEAKLSEMATLQSRIEILEKKRSETAETYEEVADEFNTQLSIWKHLGDVNCVIEKNRELNRTFGREYVLMRVRESPILLSEDISRYISESERFVEYQKLLQKVRKLEVKNASLATKKQLSIEVLNAEISGHSKRLDRLRKKHENRVSTLAEIESKRIILSEYSSVKHRVDILSGTVKDIESNAIQHASREYIIRLYNVLNRMLTDIRSNLVDITNISKEQEQIVVRLDTEVNNVIDEIKPKFEHAKIVEKSLSSLPIEYTKSFVNNIIDMTNYFISEIMTYSMQIRPITTDVFDFSFPVTIKDEVAKDISSCSVGQKAIIQLAFNLAMVLELGFEYFPMYSDEADRNMDAAHRARLTDFLLGLVDSRTISQLFVANHDKSIIDRLSSTGNIIVLNSENITLPETYNRNAKITYY